MKKQGSCRRIERAARDFVEALDAARKCTGTAEKLSNEALFGERDLRFATAEAQYQLLKQVLGGQPVRAADGVRYAARAVERIIADVSFHPSLDVLRQSVAGWLISAYDKGVADGRALVATEQSTTQS
jgi:hypothetical protein